jgi:diguanylate cyclase (GGDEF)-like protein/PAS domain S-box-containing protein
VLTKPGRLDATEVQEMEKRRQYARGILAPFCAPRIMDIVYYSQGWYDGRRHGFDLKEKRLPLGSRVLAIVDAFDAMTIDHVYRRAMTRETALAELFQNSGTQFDPELVKEFYSLLTNDRVNMTANVARRWLQQLHPESSNHWWQLEQQIVSSTMPAINDMFHQKLFDSMQDGVVFVDTQLRVLLWNRAAERLTGIPGSAVHGQRWEPSLISMSDEHGKPISSAECPLACAIKTGVQTLRRLSIVDANGNSVLVNAHMVPVIGRDGISHGAALLLHDASAHGHIEDRSEVANSNASGEGVVQVTNRAEFDRQLEKHIDTHLSRNIPFSLILCDVDHFKKINDTHGKQAGDDTLIQFAATLKKHCRAGDVVARYGRKEFVLMCPQCGGAGAASKAEAIRRELCDTPQAHLGGKLITASFGVTEIEEGDTPDIMLRRADQALFEAKESGRNRVVRVGDGMRSGHDRKEGGWFSWMRKTAPDDIIKRKLITAVPLPVAVQKLRGFVADNQARIDSITDNRVVLKVEFKPQSSLPERAERPIAFCVDLNFRETTIVCTGRKTGTSVRTLIDLIIRPLRKRDWQRADLRPKANQLQIGLLSYLMAEEFDESEYVFADGQEVAGSVS